MNKFLVFSRLFAVLSVFVVFGNVHARTFPGTCEFGFCVSQLSAEEKAEIYEKVKNGEAFLHSTEDSTSGLKHFYFYTFVPFEANDVVAAFLDFPTHAGVAGIQEVQVRKTPINPSATTGNLFEVQYALKVSAFKSRYVVDHQVFRDEQGGSGTMWRWSPETDKVQKFGGGLTKPSDIRGYLHAVPHENGALVTYYSYQVANVQKVGVPKGVANNIAESDLRKTVEDFRRKWMAMLADGSYVRGRRASCERLINSAPVLSSLLR